MAFAKRKTLKSGAVRWYASYLGADGKQHMEGGFSTQREAERLAHRREQESLRGEWIDPHSSKMTFERYLDAHFWPTTTNLELTTLAAYRAYNRKHFLPAFGAIPMNRVTAGAVQAWVNDASKTLSPTSVKKYHALLHKIFSRAVIDRVVAQNPCTHTALPKVIKRPLKIITPDEFDVLVGCLDDRHVTMVLLEIETGLRWGEVIALRPCDIDFSTRTVNVHRTLIEIAKKDSPTGERITVKNYPKSDEPRQVQIEPATCRMLRDHMMKEGRRENDLLFTSSTGTPISRNNFRTKSWLPALAKAGLAHHVNFHELRSAHASWLLAGGADLQVVMERLGHKQITTTQQYLGSLPDSGDRALEALRRTRRRMV